MCTYWRLMEFICRLIIKIFTRVKWLRRKFPNVRSPLWEKVEDYQNKRTTKEAISSLAKSLYKRDVYRREEIDRPWYFLPSKTRGFYRRQAKWDLTHFH